MEKIELIPVPLQVVQIFDDMVFVQSQLQLVEMRDIALRNMALKLRTYILAEDTDAGTHKVKVSYEVPILPLEAFPNLCSAFPELANLPTRTEVKEVSINLKRRILYPEANVRFPELGGTRRVIMMAEENCYDQIQE